MQRTYRPLQVSEWIIDISYLYSNRCNACCQVVRTEDILILYFVIIVNGLLQLLYTELVQSHSLSERYNITPRTTIAKRSPAVEQEIQSTYPISNNTTYLPYGIIIK